MEEPRSHTHILLSNMGANAPRVTTYQLGDKRCDYQFSAIALWKLLPEDQRPAEILFLLTPEAEAKAKQQIISEATEVGVDVRFIRLSGNGIPDDSREFLERVSEGVPPACRLTLDVTQGLRHHAFLFYALALYLGEFRDIDIVGAWYCRWEVSRDDKVPRPFIDLKPILDLAHWFHALAVFRETGSLRQIAQRMPHGEARDLVEQLSFFFLNGMPVEAGNVASRLVNLPSQLLESDVPLSSELQATLVNDIRPLVGPEFDPKPNSPDRIKRNLKVSDTELARQARFIDRYCDTEQFNLAFGLLREWLVSWLALQSGQNTSWLERPVRESLERNLGGLSEVLKSKAPDDPRHKRYKHQAVRDSLTEQQRMWAKRWSTVCDIRNALQHHGMKPAVFEPCRNDISTARDDWSRHASWEAPDQFGGGGGRLLICPIGLTPGVLYSALQHTEPSCVIVICSEQSESAINEACTHAGSNAELLSLRMRDIHRGVSEFGSLIDQASAWLFTADQIVANLTGGTTLMGVLVTRLIARARREYQRQVHEFVLIDSRSPQQQREDPWQLGDIYYLDGAPDGEESSADEELEDPADDSSATTEKNA